MSGPPLMRFALLALLLALPCQAMAQDHPTDDYFRMRGEADRQSSDAQRYRHDRDELLRLHEQDMKRLDELYRRLHEVPPPRWPCRNVVGVECYRE